MGQHTITRGNLGPASRGAALALAGLGLTVAFGVYAAHWLWSAEESAAPPPPEPKPQLLFKDWPEKGKPDLALILTGEQHGYLQPCGCSRPQLGGLVRRYNFIQTLKERGWPIVAVDLGDIVDHKPRRATEPQVMMKYLASMKALNKMNYIGTALGLDEIELRLDDVLANYALNSGPVPVMGANFVEKYTDGKQVDAIKSWVVGGGKDGAPRVGVVSIVSPTVIHKIQTFDPTLQFQGTKEVLPGVLKTLDKQKPDLLVLLYQGTVEEARACAAGFPQFHVILHTCRESEPSDKPERVGDKNTGPLLIGVGHKGRHIGVLGAYRTGNAAKPFDLHYQRVALGEEYETPEGKEAGHPIMDLMENYAADVKNANFVAKQPQRKHPLQVVYPDAKYVGSLDCRGCHGAEYKVWDASRHSTAFHSLEEAKKPSLRQFDPECVVCHVVGYGYQTGYTDEKKSFLHDVGCESCHGPGSQHIKEIKTNRNGKDDLAIRALMNPNKYNPNETEQQATDRLNRIDQSCQQCHDTDNDVHWDFKKKWPSIVHHKPLGAQPAK